MTKETGEKIGTTPLELDGPTPDKLRGDRPFLNIVVRKEGFEKVFLKFEPLAVDALNLKLTAQDESGFRNQFLKEHSQSIQKMISRFLSAQRWRPTGLCVPNPFL